MSVTVTPVKEMRHDGYVNMLNKAGTQQDNSNAYRYYPGMQVDDVYMSNLYVGNGLFAKIIDRPARDAIARGLDLTDFGDDLSKRISKKLNKLKWKEAVTTAEEWSRLFGGSIIVMITDDGRGLDEPLDINKVTRVRELHVFERAIISPDYSHFGYTMYDFDDDPERPYGQPLYYDVFSQHGSFRVHYSRCLIFRNGKFPEYASIEYYRDWGVPVYYRVAKAVRMAVSGHEDAERLLERSTLGIYKMKGLNQVLATDAGENKTLTRLQAIDMSRHILNSIAIDADGEDYSYLTTSMAGVSDVLEKLENYLSSVTDIPQTILFGASPSGMDATGDNDMQNYYQLLSSIQEQNTAPAAETLLSCILNEFRSEDGTLRIPDYEIRFNPFHQESESEKVTNEKTKADTDATNANTMNTYIAAGLISKEEGRAALARPEGFDFRGFVEPDKVDQMPEAPEQNGGQGNDNPPDGDPNGGLPAAMPTSDVQTGSTDIPQEVTPQVTKTPEISSITYKFKTGWQGEKVTSQVTPEGETVEQAEPIDEKSAKEATDTAARLTGQKVTPQVTIPTGEDIPKGKATPEVTPADEKSGTDVASKTTTSDRKGAEADPIVAVSPKDAVRNPEETAQNGSNNTEETASTEKKEVTPKVTNSEKAVTDEPDNPKKVTSQVTKNGIDGVHDRQQEDSEAETADSDALIIPEDEKLYVPVDEIQQDNSAEEVTSEVTTNKEKEKNDEFSEQDRW